MDDPRLIIDATPCERNKATVTARLGGEVLHLDCGDLASAEFRTRFAAAVCNGRGGIAPEHIESELLRLASQLSVGPGKQRSTPNIVRLADVKPTAVQWLWPGRFALGKLSLLVGDPGLGKSFLTLDIAARVSRGAAWPDAPNEPNPAGGVVLISAEDDLADTIRPRLDAAGACIERINALESVNRGHATDAAFCLQRDLPALEQAVEATPGCRLVVIDPITSYLGSTDSHKNAEIRAVLKPLGDFAARHRLAVIVISHLNKSAGTPAMYRTMGSLAFTAAARAVWCVTKDKSDERRRLVLPVKNNLGTDDSGLAYRLETLSADGMPVVAWEAEPVRQSADDALAAERDDEGGGALAEAMDWLRHLLQANGGQLESGKIKAMAKSDGIAERTLRRAKDSLGVEAKPGRFGGPWAWTLPNAEPEPAAETRQSWPTAPELAKPQTLANSGNLGQHWTDAPPERVRYEL